MEITTVSVLHEFTGKILATLLELTTEQTIYFTIQPMAEGVRFRLSSYSQEFRSTDRVFSWAELAQANPPDWYAQRLLGDLKSTEQF